MRLIGHIRQLQIQQDALKKGEGAERTYDLGALSIVPAARLTSEGVIGLIDTREIHDLHHSWHHRSKHRQSNAISFNFAQNYERMRRRFGSELSMGCGGENILIELVAGVELAPLLENLEVTLVIETEDSLRGNLTGIKVAKPCVPFSEYVLNTDAKPPAGVVKETLQFLDGGMRGYYCAWEGAPLEVRMGDKVLTSV
ncbi:MAG: hypothetical protein WA996_05045 [Candidatus Promineifilaceae bacterium]